MQYSLHESNFLLLYVICSYAHVYKCWKAVPDDRPTFMELSNTFEETVHELADYLELDMALESKLSGN